MIKECIVKRASIYYEEYKHSQNFTAGNTRKVSACFLRLHVCDVMQIREEIARMRISSQLAPVANLVPRVASFSSPGAREDHEVGQWHVRNSNKVNGFELLCPT